MPGPQHRRQVPARRAGAVAGMAAMAAGAGVTVLLASGGIASGAVPAAGGGVIDPWQRTFSAEDYRVETTTLFPAGGTHVGTQDLAAGTELIEVPDLLVKGTSRAVAAAAVDAHGVVLDLRGSRGGLVTEAVAVAGVFLGPGAGLTYTRTDGTSRVLPLPDDALEVHAPLVVLVDDRTASAAEAVAGVLRDHGRAVIVGEATFGKGTVQEPAAAADGSVVRGTVGAYLLPSGAGVGASGLVPDVVLADASDDQAAADVARRVLSGLADGQD